MIETTRVDKWIYGLLSGDATLGNLVNGIYSYLAPPDAMLPFIVFSYQGGHDIRGVGPFRFLTNVVYQVKAIGDDGSFRPLQAIADRLDTLLQAASGSVVDGQILMCVREQPIQYVEVEGGTRYQHLGGLYRIYCAER